MFPAGERDTIFLIIILIIIMLIMEAYLSQSLVPKTSSEIIVQYLKIKLNFTIFLSRDPREQQCYWMSDKKIKKIHSLDLWSCHSLGYRSEKKKPNGEIHYSQEVDHNCITSSRWLLKASHLRNNRNLKLYTLSIRGMTSHGRHLG